MRKHILPLRHCLIPVLFLLVLSSCATGPSPQKTQNIGSCNTVGKVHSLNSTLPSSQGEWPTFHGNINRDGSQPTGGSSKLTLAWTYCTGAPVFSSPIVHNGLVYVASTTKTLTALDIHSGRVMWQLKADSVFYSTPTVQDNIVYAASLDGTLYALSARTGTVQWHHHVDVAGAKIWSSPVVVNGLVIFGIASTLSEKPKIVGQLQALDAKTGALRWRYFTLPGGVAGGGIWSSPAIDAAHNVLYVATGDPDDGAVALTLQDGHLLWHWRSVVRDIGDTDIGSGPTLYQDQKGQLRVAVGGKDGFIYSLDAGNGRVVWHTSIGKQVFSFPTFANGTLYAVGVNGRSSVSWALDAQTGNPRWQHPIPVIVYASPAISGQVLYLAVGNGFGPGDGGIEVVDSMRGQLLQNINLHSPTSSSPAVIASWLFVGSFDGNLYAFTR